MIGQWEDRLNAAEAWYMRRFFLGIGIWMFAVGVSWMIAPWIAPGARPNISDTFYGLCWIGAAVYMIRLRAAWMTLVLGALLVISGPWSAVRMHSQPNQAKLLYPSIEMMIPFTVVVCAFLYAKYRRFAKVRAVEPALIAEIDLLIRRVMRGKPSQDEAIAALRTRYGDWKIGLLDDEILAVSQFGSDLCFAQRHEASAEYNGDPEEDRYGKITLKLGRRRWKGRMSSSHYKRLADWLAAGGGHD